MSNTAVPASESLSASTAVLPQLRSSRHGSMASISTASRLEKETRAHTLDQIHNSACHTDTLTTFNEFTAPPSASSGTDGKGIASELHGGLSGLYNRLRASVGNVRDIVSHMSEDGNPEDKPLPVQNTRQATDASKASNFPTTSLNPAQGPATGRPSVAENLSSDHAKTEKDQINKSSKNSAAAAAGAPLQVDFSSSSIPTAPIVPLTQTVPRVAALPAVAEVNVSAIKERDRNGEPSSYIPNGKANTPSKQLLALSPELLLIANIDKQNPETPRGNLMGGEIGKPQRAQVSRSNLDNIQSATTRFPDNTVNNRLRTARRSGYATNDDYIVSDPGFESIGEPILSPTKPSSGTSKSMVEAPRIIQSSASPRSESGAQAGDIIDGAATEPSQKWNHQHLEPPFNKPLVPSVTKLTRSPGSHQSQASRESFASSTLDISRPNLSSNGSGGDLNGRRATIDSQYKAQVTSPQNYDPRTINVFSQIKSKILNKEYWMRDENARDCFYCGDPFSTFRRKHHCSRWL